LAQPGRTQDLQTGVRAEPELLHRAFPAAEVLECLVIGPFREDPPVDYKTVRLASPKTETT
jgi:hypothetical protein